MRDSNPCAGSASDRLFEHQTMEPARDGKPRLDLTEEIVYERGSFW